MVYSEFHTGWLLTKLSNVVLSHIILRIILGRSCVWEGL